jgi:hypothetical protein
MFGATALLIAAAAVQGEAGRDLSRLLPIYAEPKAFVSQPGERIRLGSYMPPKDRLDELLELGVRLFVGETDRLAPPDKGTGPYSVENLKAQRAVAQEAGAKWGLDVYSAFTTVDEAQAVGEGTVEVRSKEKVPAWSPWNPERIRFSANRYGRINRAFSGLAFVSAGMFGEFGDASMFSGLTAYAPDLAVRWENSLKVDAPKPGFWSGDPMAMESWRRALIAKHGDIPKAYTAWGMTPDDPNLLPVPLDASYPYVARLEYQDWYRSALPSMGAALADIGVNVFKNTPIVIPLGPPNDLPELGLDVFRLAEAVRPNAAALKVTNLGLYDFAENWAISLGKVRGAAKAAGVPVVTASPYGSPEEFSERLFEALALGATAMIDAPSAFLGNRRNLADLSKGLVHEPPRTDVAILHPTSSHLLNPGRPTPAATYRGAVELRDYADFDILEETAVVGGGLAPYRVAVLYEGSIWRQATLEALKKWVSEGGTVVAHDFGKMADPRGNTSVYQELFGFGAELPAAPESLRWQGEVPASYRIDVGATGDEKFVLRGWGEADGTSRRAFPGAVLRLPIKEGTSVVTVTLNKAPAGGRVEFKTGERLLAGVGSDGGVKQVQFAIDSGMAKNGVLLITAGGFDGNAELRIDTIDVAADAASETVLLTGSFDAPITIENVKSWTRAYGKGAAVFAPLGRGAREQYLSVVRHAVFSLTQLGEGKRDAPAVDNRADGVYALDLGDRIGVFNSTNNAIEWGESKLVIPARGLRFLEKAGTGATIVVQAEAFATPTAPLTESSASSPGVGLSAVRVGENAAFETVITAPETRTYRLYARTLRNGQPVPVRFKVGAVEAAPVSAGTGDVYLIGEFTLTEGANIVQMISDKTFLADLLIATAEPGVVGFKFSPKF